MCTLKFLKERNAPWPTGSDREDLIRRLSNSRLNIDVLEWVLENMCGGKCEDGPINPNLPALALKSTKKTEGPLNWSEFENRMKTLVIRHDFYELFQWFNKVRGWTRTEMKQIKDSRDPRMRKVAIDSLNTKR